MSSVATFGLSQTREFSKQEKIASLLLLLERAMGGSFHEVIEGEVFAFAWHEGNPEVWQGTLGFRNLTEEQIVSAWKSEPRKVELNSQEMAHFGVELFVPGFNEGPVPAKIAEGEPWISIVQLEYGFALAQALLPQPTNERFVQLIDKAQHFGFLVSVETRTPESTALLQR